MGENNLNLVAEKFAQNLFDKSVDRLSGSNVTLPDAVCVAHILSALIAEAAISITAERLAGIMNAAEQWSFESNSQNTIVPTASEEASVLLTELLPKAIEQVSESTTELDIQDKIQRIVKKTNFNTVRNAAEALLGSN